MAERLALRQTQSVPVLAELRRKLLTWKEQFPKFRRMPSAVQNNTVYELFNSVTIYALSIWAREIVQDCSSRVFETTCARHVQVASPFLESPERPVVYPHCEAASAAVIAKVACAIVRTTHAMRTPVRQWTHQ